MKFSQPLRLDYESGIGSFVTRRLRNSQLAFVNNKPLEDRMLGYLGKMQDKYSIKIYAYTIFGSHDHLMTEFKPGTKSNFYRDFGARTAEAIKKHVPDFGTGAAFERRPSEQAITKDKESHLNQFFYTVLQPIAAGLCKNLSDYPGFNSFKYAATGKPLKVEFFRWADYLRAKMRNKSVDASLFLDKYELSFKRLPGYEGMSQKEYRKFLFSEYEKRRKEIIDRLDKAGHIWPNSDKLKKVKSSDTAKNPKRSTRYSKRPVVLSLCLLARQNFLEWYFDKLEKFKCASSLYLLGDSNTVFPSGTCKPPGPWVPV